MRVRVPHRCARQLCGGVRRRPDIAPELRRLAGRGRSATQTRTGSRWADTGSCSPTAPRIWNKHTFIVLFESLAYRQSLCCLIRTSRSCRTSRHPPPPTSRSTLPSGRSPGPAGQSAAWVAWLRWRGKRKRTGPRGHCWPMRALRWATPPRGSASCRADEGRDGKVLEDV